jgi:hypothetical protein
MYPCLVDVFNENECKDIVKKLDNIKDSWIKRVDSHPCLTYTLGATTYHQTDYLDGYYKIYKENNKIILDNFGTEFEKILEVLNKQVGNSELENSLAVPGFNIFTNTSENKISIVSIEGMNVHTDFVDEAHKKVFEKKYKKIDYEEKISFTLALELPRGGSGLSIWGDSSLNKYDHDHEFSKIIKKIGFYKNDQPSIVNYYVGKAFIFSGKYPHQVTPTVKYYQGDRRITIQGHAIKCDGKYRWFV